MPQPNPNPITPAPAPTVIQTCNQNPHPYTLPPNYVGYDLHEIARCFAQAVDALRSQSTAQGAALSLVVHDWGVVPGFYYSNSAGCDKLIVFDVLVNEKPDNMYYALVQLNYQAMFALSFRLSRVWSLLGKIWLAVRTTLIFGMFRRWLSPIGPADHAHGFFGHAGLLPWQEPDVDRAGGKRVTTYRCYPYFHALKNLPPGSDAAQQILEKVGFDSSVKKQPICYVFGAQKNTHFHLESNLKKLRETPGCEVHGLEGTGHWCYKHAPQKCFEIVRDFIMA